MTVAALVSTFGAAQNELRSFLVFSDLLDSTIKAQQRAIYRNRSAVLSATAPCLFLGNTSSHRFLLSYPSSHVFNSGQQKGAFDAHLLG
mmetsp:Transcript_47921/g.103259  ORF Transcript_47921/g.103259 Transcript_47921/m.103259 type:complete len:89 (+) Transcript_47921:35-301(+)